METPHRETQCIRIPLRAGQTDRFLAWVRSMQGREAEQLDAMRAEGVSFESIFLETSERGDSIIFYIKAASLLEMQRVFALSTRTIDVEARAMIEACWDTEHATVLAPCLELIVPPR